MIGNIIPTIEQRIRRHEQHLQDPVIHMYREQMTFIMNRMPLKGMICMSTGEFEMLPGDGPLQTELDKLQKELNEYIELNYSDVLNQKS